MNIIKSVLILVACLIALTLSYQLKPVPNRDALNNAPDLEELIPYSFGNWKVDESLPIVLGSPDQDSLVNLIYSQQLSRTYVDSNGYRVMLSISYGDIQNKSTQVHFPEVCYPAQGFDIVDESYSDIVFEDYVIPTKRLETALRERREYVTYWIRYGDDIVLSRFQQKLKSIKYGFYGKVPDGLLFRVSTINLLDNYEVHNRFINNLLQNLDAVNTRFVIGK